LFLKIADGKRVFMSVRLSRKQHGGVIAKRLEQLRDQRSGLDGLEQALMEAQAALAEEPRALTSCELKQEYIAVQVWNCERMHCSECNETITGVPEGWRFCPACGSRVTQFTREDSPHDRLNQAALAEAMKAFEVGLAEPVRK
jgi:hypothetical protein